MRTAAQAAEQVEARTKPGPMNRETKPRKANARTILKALVSDQTPDEKFRTERLEDGTCHLDPLFSMKRLGMPNVEYQARHDKLNPGHAARFAAMLVRGDTPAPVVIFRSIVREIIDGVTREIVSLILADGFHRHHAFASLKRAAIPAYIIDVSHECLEDQARLYAAMCNQINCLPRTPEDKREAVRMTCAVPECEGWTDRQVADHCGVDERTVKATRMEYLIEHKKDLLVPPKRRKLPDRPVEGRRDVIPVMPGSNVLPPGAEAEPTPADLRPPLHNTRLFNNWLRNRGVIAKPPPQGATTGLYINGLLAGDLAIVPCEGSDVDQVCIASFKALLLREAAAAGSRATVVLDRRGEYRKLCALAEGAGVGFVSPEELVEALKAIQDAGKV